MPIIKILLWGGSSSIASMSWYEHVDFENKFLHNGSSYADLDGISISSWKGPYSDKLRTQNIWNKFAHHKYLIKGRRRLYSVQHSKYYSS